MPSSTAATAFPSDGKRGLHGHHARAVALQVRQDAEVRWRDEDCAGAARVGGRPGQRRSDEHRPGPVEIGRGLAAVQLSPTPATVPDCEMFPPDCPALAQPASTIAAALASKALAARPRRVALTVTSGLASPARSDAVR